MPEPTPGDERLLRPHPSRLDPASPRYSEVLRAHADAVRAGASGYLDPVTGLFVFTARFLLDRGTCCESGCRHCPYVGPTPARLDRTVKRGLD